MGKIYDSITWLQDGERENALVLNRPLKEAVTKIEDEIYNESGTSSIKTTSITETFPISTIPAGLADYSVVYIDNSGNFQAALDDGVKNNFVGIIKIVTKEDMSQVVELKSVGEVVFPDSESLTIGATYYLSKDNEGKITSSPTDTMVGICVKANTLLLKGSSSGGGSSNVVIDDSTVAADKVWSSQLTQNEIFKRAGIDDNNTSATTVWSSQKTYGSILSAANILIDDNTASDLTTWSSNKLNEIVQANKSIKVEDFSDDTLAPTSGALNVEYTNDTAGAVVVNINIDVSTTAGTTASKDTYLGDLTVYYNNTSQVAVKESIISKNITGAATLTYAIGNVIVDSGDKLIFSASTADVWDAFSGGVRIHTASISKSGDTPDPESFVNGLIFTSLKNGSTIQINDSSNSATLEYKTEIGGISSPVADYVIGSKLTFNQGDKIILRNKGTQTDSSLAGKLNILLTGNFVASKSVNYLFNKTGVSFTLNEGQFEGLFENSSGLTQAPTLPSTLVKNCFKNMFAECSGLITAPALPATTVVESCYEGMFRNCTSLTTTPTFVANNTAKNCYKDMFSGCSKLENVPSDLVANTAAEGCYSSMFSGCSKLVVTPELYATTLGVRCYEGMFKGCTSLVTAPELPATTLAEYCYKDMFNGCTSLTEATILDASTLVGNCYQGMFQGCSSLNITEKNS